MNRRSIAQDSVDLAQWLQEAGRRRIPPPVRRPPAALSHALRSDWTPLKHAVLLIAGAGAVAQYCYADTMLQILLLRSVIVFVSTGGH